MLESITSVMLAITELNKHNQLVALILLALAVGSLQASAMQFCTG